MTRSMMLTVCVLLMVACVSFSSVPAAAAPILTVVETAGDYYTITAHDSVDPGIEFWEIRVDVASGAIYSFKDLTDAGDGSGGHTDYLGDGAYNRNGSLLVFEGRGGRVVTRAGALTGLADRLTFTAAPDGSSFTIAYTETAASTDFFHDVYGADLVPGELLTTITVVIRPPTPDGTFWDWSISGENVSTRTLTPKIWAVQWVRTEILSDFVKTAAIEESLLDRPWDPASPVSYAGWVIGSNPTYGLTPGRELILDYQTGLAPHTAGGTVAQTTWAWFDRLEYAAPFDFSGNDVAPGATHDELGQFIINIASDAVAGTPFANAGPDQTVTASSPDGLAVQLDGSGSDDADGTIVSYSWAADDIEIATGVAPMPTLAAGYHTIELTVTDNDSLTDTDSVLIAVEVSGADRVFYVDFDNGADGNHGRSPAAPFQHCPGDVAASGVASSTTPEPGDMFIFKGGVLYRGLVQTYQSGSAAKPIIYDGNTAGEFGTGRAVLDGSEPLTGWTQCASADDVDGNPDWASIYYADAPAGVTVFSANLYEDDVLIGLAQDPNGADPFWIDDLSTYKTFDTATSTTIVDADYFTMGDPTYWDGDTYILTWAGANHVTAHAVTGYDPAASEVAYSPSISLHYDPGKYSMCNSLQILDTPGEYVVRSDQIGATGGPRVYLWPTAAGAPTNMTVSVRPNTFQLRDASYITVQGFTMQKATGGMNQSGGTGSAIRNYNGAFNGITIRDNLLTKNNSWERQAVITLGDVTDCIVENNEVVENVRSRGMLLTDCTNASIRGNLVRKNGGTGIGYFGAINSEIVGNTVLSHIGVHANGITVYLDSADVVIARNIVRGGNIAFTCQESDNLTVAYNVFETSIDAVATAVWSRCEGVDFHNNVIRTLGRPGSGISIGSTGNIGIVARNNIVDGSNVAYQGGVSENNIYTSLMWTQTSGSLGTGEVEASPDDLFVDAAAGDFRLKAGCVAIDAGLDLGYAIDIEGNPVPQGSAPDIGAYEGTGATAKPGDCDGDGDVDLDDFVILKQNFGRTDASGPSGGDLDGDVDVDLDDFVILKQNFGT